MTKIHENKMTMYLGVSEILNHYPDVVQILPAFKTAQEEFKQQIEAIKTKSKEKDAVTAGKTITKNETRTRLIDKVLSVAASIYTHAVETGNNELKVRCNLRKSYLRNCRDIKIIQLGESVYETAAQQAANLAIYGIQPETLTDLSKRIQDYKQAFGDREQSVAHRKTARLALQYLFGEVDAILRNRLDRLMENFKATHPDFYGRIGPEGGLRICRESGGGRQKPNRKNQRRNDMMRDSIADFEFRIAD